MSRPQLVPEPNFEILPKTLETGESYGGYISHIDEGKRTFYFTLNADLEALGKIGENLAQVENPEVSETPEPGSFVMAKHPEYEGFYRAAIESRGGHLVAYYVDYGNSVLVEKIKPVYLLDPELCEILQLCVKISSPELADISETRMDKIREWSDPETSAILTLEVVDGNAQPVIGNLKIEKDENSISIQKYFDEEICDLDITPVPVEKPKIPPKLETPPEPVKLEIPPEPLKLETPPEPLKPVRLEPTENAIFFAMGSKIGQNGEFILNGFMNDHENDLIEISDILKEKIEQPNK